MKKRVFRFAALAAILAISPVMAYSGDDMQDMVVSEDLTEEYSDDIMESQDDSADEEYTGLISDPSEVTLFSAADDDDDDDDEEETEETEKDPEPIESVSIDNVYFRLQPGTKPKYLAKVTHGNAAIRYEGWTDQDGHVNYSSAASYQDDDIKFTKFEKDKIYTYHLSIIAEDSDYFTDTTRFWVNGVEQQGTLNSAKTICTFDNIFNGVAECLHEYRTYEVEATCTTPGREYKQCTYCGDEITIKTTPATGHNYELDEDQSAEATCTRAGKEVYVCGNEDCGAVYQKTLPALGHHLVYEVEDKATDTEEGTYTVSCDHDGCDFIEKSYTIFPFKKIKLLKDKYPYTGSAIIPSFTVTDSIGKVIDPRFYTVVYIHNKDIGTATLHLTFSGRYSGKMRKTFQIVKGSQAITLNASSITVPKADVKKKTIKINLGARAKTKLTYKSKSKKIKVNKKGIVTLKKGTKKGTYTITITAKESKNWKKATKKIKIKVK